MRRVGTFAALVVVVAALGGCAPGSPAPVRSSSLTRLPPPPAPSAATTEPEPSPAGSSPAAVPGYLLNPAVTQDTITWTICDSGWTATVRPPSSYTSALKRRQLPAGADPAGYEEDHQIALEIGGAPRNPTGPDGRPALVGNLWPEPKTEAHGKDVFENAEHRDVCAGRLTLAAAQAAMYQRWRQHP